MKKYLLYLGVWLLLFAHRATAQVSESFQAFPVLDLQDTAGNMVSSAIFKGKTTYVDFWFTTCTPCIKEIPFSTALQQRFAGDTNVLFVTICIEHVERKAAWKQAIEKYQWPGLHLFYARNRPQRVNLLRKYNITFPTYLLLNAAGNVVDDNAPRPSEFELIFREISNLALGSGIKGNPADE